MALDFKAEAAKAANTPINLATFEAPHADALVLSQSDLEELVKFHSVAALEPTSYPIQALDIATQAIAAARAKTAKNS